MALGSAPSDSARTRRLSGLAVLIALLAASPIRAEDDWKYDVIVLKDKDNTTLKGLLVNYKETAPDVEIRVPVRKPGEKTRIETYIYKREMIDSVELLGDKDRAVLEARLRALDITGAELAKRIRELELEQIDFGKGGKKNGLRYADPSGHFVLDSNVKEALFRKTAVRLAQVYNAYARYLPARHHSAKPTSVLLAATLGDYQALLKERGLTFTNPAFYDPARNQIVCGSDLDRLGTQLEQARKDNQKVRDDLDEREKELNKLYKGKVPAAVMRPITEARQQLARSEEANGKLTDEATRALMQRLYHESFHAYVGTFVYPAGEAEMPRWLNEGLAQIFETAVFEADEVRIGHADPDRLKRAKEALSADTLVPLKELLRSGPKQFLVVHSSDKETSDRYYLTSWALASYLAFDRKILNTKELDAYCRATQKKADPVESFCDLVGIKPAGLPQFEKDFRAYLQHLRHNGTVAKPK
jgi:hypothetical protein